MISSAEEQAVELEALIGAFVKTGRAHATDRGIAVLKHLAKELRGRAPQAPLEALHALQRRIADAAATATKTSGAGFDPRALVGLGQELIGRWPTVRQALERFSEELKRTE